MKAPESKKPIKPFTGRELKLGVKKVARLVLADVHEEVDRWLRRTSDAVARELSGLDQFTAKLESNRVTALETFQNVLQLSGVIAGLARRVEALEEAADKVGEYNGVPIFAAKLRDHDRNNEKAYAEFHLDDGVIGGVIGDDLKEKRNFVRREQYRKRKAAALEEIAEMHRMRGEDRERRPKRAK